MEEEPKGALLADLGLPQAREAAVGGGTRVVRLSSGIAVSENYDRRRLRRPVWRVGRAPSWRAQIGVDPNQYLVE